MKPDPASTPEHPEQDPAFRDVLDTLRAWPDAPAPNLAPTVLARIRARRRLPLALAAALLALLGASLLVLRNAPAPDDAFVSVSDAFYEEVPDDFAMDSTPALVAEEPADSDLLNARDWLLRQQDADGGWTMGRTGAAANYTVGTSALALLALLGGEPEDAMRESLARGAAFLASRQGGDGLFGPAITGSLYNHTLACLALLRLRDAGAARTDGDHALRDGLALIVRSQRPEGGWTYLRSRGAPNSSLTVWALRVLAEARERGVADYTAELERGLAWLARTVDEEGRAGYRRGGDHPHGSETLTAAAALCFLDRGADLDPRLARMVDNIRRDIGDAAAPLDLYRTFFQAAALRADPEPDTELPALAARLRAVQDLEGDDAGSWPPLDRWSSAGGRVYSTALALLALNGG
ncbi:MAG TPA: hypothetical protein PKE12_08115 [Kiritimatiellia bacterium]|nr:hypothetical protein [Kiritimatiellia bacterium]